MKNDFRHLLLASLILPVCMAFAPIAHADSSLLTVGGYEINVNSFSFGASQTPLGEGEVEFNVDMGPAIPFLAQSVAEGTHFETAVLDVFHAGAADPFETISFSNLIATNISFNPGGTPTEDVDFAYERIEIEYGPGGTSPIPEPGSFMLLGSGLVGLAVMVPSGMVRRS